ncbi:MAG: hypothetical protein HeimC3_17870 [Candidatus Heimdallarchaeota archaeon LC_3]|nr:MAG: hypothetical protein HeimC3_17870 [Candidatus Heimdallarchaeota archaeon LC_3]
MPWIKTIDESEAMESLKDIYNDLERKRGKVANILKIHSLLPKTMETHMALYLSVMFNQSKISREDRELLAIIVSMTNQCQYCIFHHAKALNNYWKNKERIKNLLDHGYKNVRLSQRQLQQLNYAEKLTLSPHQITEEDIMKLKNIGLSDEEILQINLVVSYFNFVNRIVLGLNVEFSEEEISGYKY